MTDPIASLGEVEEGLGAGALSGPVGGGSGNPVAPEDPEADPDAAPVTLEQAQLLAGAGGAGGALNQLPQTVSTLAREYVWGPGDWHPGVDELLVQYAGSTEPERNKPWWVVQDAGGDVVSLCENALPAQAGGTPGPTTVAAQWTYDAFGSALTAEHLAAHPFVHLGHKGLFFDRLDVGVVSTLGTELPRLAPYAHLVVQMRNRAYLPGLGRFLQRDPNATAMALIEASAMHGRGLGAIALAFDMQGMYGDGGNLYAYLGSNPWSRHDALGLSYDPFDMVDEYLAEATGNAAALLSQIGQGMAATAVVVATVASYLPFPITSTLGDLALVALGQESGEEYAIGAAMGLIPGGKLMSRFGGIASRLGSFVGRLGSSAWSSAKYYAGRFTGFLSNKVHGLAARAKAFFNRKPANVACGCFTAGTLVWATTGLVPIESLREGDLVLVRETPGGPITAKPVVRQIVTDDAAVLEVRVVHCDSGRETIQTTDEHPFWVAGRGWTRADQLNRGDVLSTLRGPALVDGLLFTSERTTVYNLSVAGSPNYMVGADGVWVHNCTILDNLGSHVVHSPHHNWQRMFGGVPSIDDVRTILREVAETGVPISDAMHPSGMSQRFEKQIKGHTVWADVFLDQQTNTLRLTNGGIK